MTITLHKAEPQIPSTPWSSMPGWGIVADLTPPELRARRALGVLKKVIGASMALLLAICVGGYVLANRSANSAQEQLGSANAQTAVIQAQIDKHSTVTRLQNATSGIETQLSGLFATDVDVSRLVRDLADALPAGMDVTSINLTLTGSSATDTSVDPSEASIGTVTLAGTSSDLNDLARYVSALNGLRGVTAVIPSTNTASGKAVSWTLSLQLTTERYTKRFGAGSVTTAPVGSTPTDTTSTGGN